MSFQSLAGQDRVKRMLQNGLRNHSLAHAYIFNGANGSGRREMAMTLAKAVYCQESIDDACGQCLNCRKVEHHNHPDFVWIEPDGVNLKIEQIRSLQQQFTYRSATSQTKVYVIQDAERMTNQAANSLLKFLEEPNSDMLAILITENGHALLPTIQSRAQWVSFISGNTKELQQQLVLEGFERALILPAVQITVGQEAVRRLIQEDWFAEIRNVVIQLAKEAFSHFPEAHLTIQRKVIATEWVSHLAVFLDLSILWYKDIIHFICGRQANMVYDDQLEWIRQHAFSRNMGFWVNSIILTVELQKKLRFNANPQLALEKWVIDLQRRV